MVSERRNEAQALSGLTMKRAEHETFRFAVCINNADYPASLELHKILPSCS